MILSTGKAPVGPWIEKIEAKLGKKLPGAFLLGEHACHAAEICLRLTACTDVVQHAGLVLHGSEGEVTHTRSLDNGLCEDIFAVGKRFSAPLLHHAAACWHR